MTTTACFNFKLSAGSMMSCSTSSSLRCSVSLCAIVFSALLCCGLAKKVTGKVKLSGSNSEVLLTKFALDPYARGHLDLTLKSKNMYEDESSLKIRYYRDNRWDNFLKATTCIEKTRFSRRTLAVAFERDDGEWKAEISTKLWQERDPEAHYWYIVLDDCSLEQRYHDYAIPELEYTLEVWNDVGGNHLEHDDKDVTLTHLSADETGLKRLHAVTLVISLVVTFLMTMRIGMLVVDKGTVHAALLLVAGAAACDSLASLCKIIHLNVYENNGVGSYFFDALSSHLEAVCDSVVALLLLSFAAGWTLPSDAMMVSRGGNASVMSKVMEGMRSPIGALMQHNVAGLFALCIFVFHTVLAQWGRTYDDDFDSYHALEHLPGRILMIFRVFLGMLLVVSSVHTASRCSNPTLAQFYIKLAVVGTIWFQSLPLTTWICGWALPYYARHHAVAVGSALVQTASLLALSWLVTAHSGATSYHSKSRLGSNNGDLTDELASRSSIPKSWKFGKAKIRLD